MIFACLFANCFTCAAAHVSPRHVCLVTCSTSWSWQWNFNTTACGRAVRKKYNLTCADGEAIKNISTSKQENTIQFPLHQSKLIQLVKDSEVDGEDGFPENFFFSKEAFHLHFSQKLTVLLYSWNYISFPCRGQLMQTCDFPAWQQSWLHMSITTGGACTR